MRARILAWSFFSMLAIATSAFAARPMQTAITFDDLPGYAPLPPGISQTDVVKSVLETLKAHRAPPAYGFLNAVWLEKQPGAADLLQRWRAAGQPLGNHGFTHMDANKNPASAFEQDILADEPALQKYMGGEDWHWLRLPYLNQGDTPEKRKEIGDFAKAHGYRIAQVTLGFDDWAYSEPYARCMAKGDTQAVAWMKKSFLDRAAMNLPAAQKMSRLLYGRSIKHVLLLHMGAFTSLMLPQLLNLYKRHGVKLISLPEAESDPAYKAGSNQRFAWGGTMLAEQMVARNIPIPQVANRDGDTARLASLCK